MNFKDAILETRQNLNSRTEDSDYDRIVPPHWLLINDEIGPSHFKELFENQDVLFSEGTVVWGRLIQANSFLFSPGPDDHPAVVLYSLDEEIDSNPKIIRKAAKKIYKLKGKRTDPDLQNFSDMLKSEHTRKWKIPIPPHITNNIQCFYTTSLIIRKHLPDGYLYHTQFPYLVCPEKTNVGTILPSRYWSEKFIKRYWTVVNY